MKKVLSAAVLASAIYLAAPVTYANDGEAFIAVNAGQSRFGSNQLLMPRQLGPDSGPLDKQSIDRTDRAFSVSAGYRWAMSDTLKLGFEGGYVDLGEVASRYQRGSVYGWYTDEKRKEKAKAPFLGLNGRWTITGKWSLMARAGIARYRSRFTVDGQYWMYGLRRAPFHDNQDRSSNAYYYGVAVGYDITPRLGIALSFDEYAPRIQSDEFGLMRMEKVHVRVSGIRAEYRF